DGPRAGCGSAVKAAGEHVGRKFLVAEDCQPLFEGELEPVTAGDPVARPVVEVFVTDDGLDGAVGAVGGGGRVGQYIGRIEDVQALVFHGAHIEVARRDNHEAIQVELQAVAFFVPAQGSQQAVHSPFGATLGAVVAVDLQKDLPATARPDGLLAAGEIARHHGKQVARLGVRVFPYGFVAAF